MRRARELEAEEGREGGLGGPQGALRQLYIVFETNFMNKFKKIGLIKRKM